MAFSRKISEHAQPSVQTDRRTVLFGSLAALASLSTLPVLAKAGDPPAPRARQVPPRSLPVPDTISDVMRPVVGAPLPAHWDEVPQTPATWRQLAATVGDHSGPTLQRIQNELRVSVASDTLGGVPVFVSTPLQMPLRNAGRTLLHLHGGGYVLFPGLVGAGEGMMMAGYSRCKVVSVDYRMAPDHPFPAALDDAEAAWRALAARQDPRTMAVFGTSAGGGLALSLLLRLRGQAMPLPAAAGLGSPWADLTGDGDTINANAYVDNAIVSLSGWVGAAAKLYAGSASLSDPLVSPIFGDLAGLPPAILTSGTRDLLLSDTVRVHRKLRQAGVEAALQVFEAQSHAQFLTPFAPETAEAFGEIGAFFDRHLQT